MDAGENFPMHTQAKVQSRMSLNAPGVNTPLTAQNASYRVGVMVRMEVDAEPGPVIESSIIPINTLAALVRVGNTLLCSVKKITPI
ncbi:hypothetical protein JB92DRAFT_2208486 [Gautieria morchelliformis]|nr:hypothetical protein JB92DRAFT_2208486 [Gautieria morchelliformis]